MAEADSGTTHEPRGDLDESSRRIDIELFALAAGITKEQALEFMKQYGEDHETLVREARVLASADLPESILKGG